MISLPLIVNSTLVLNYVMDGRLTRDLHNAELRQQSSSSDLNHRANTRWQRSVKRKYDDVSLDVPRNTVLGNADVWKASCSSEVAQDRIPTDGYNQRASCNLREAPVLTRISDVDEEVAEGYSEQLNSSDLLVPVPHLCGPSSPSEYQHFMLSGATLHAGDVELDVERPGGNESGDMILFSKKNMVLRSLLSKSQTCLRVGPIQNSASEEEIVQLREALKSERKALNRLYVELEEERCASASAANEAMAMISRLQEEKAAILMEAHQYRRVAEEREVHTQEVIALLETYVMNKENDLLALQDQIEAYRTVFLRIEYEGLGLGRGRSNSLEGLDKEGSLFLEGQGTTSLPSCTGSKYSKGPRQNQIDNSGICISNRPEEDCESWNLQRPGPKTSNQSKPLVSGGVSMNLAEFFDDVGCGYDERQVENTYVRNMDTGEWMLEGSVNRKHALDKNMTWGRHRFEEAEMVDLTSSRVQGTFETYKSETVNDIRSQEHNPDDASESILARVKRLEERFQALGKTQAYEDQGINLNVEASQNNAIGIGDVESETTGSTSQDSALEALYDKSKRFSVKVQEYTKCSSFGRGVEDLENTIHGEVLHMANGERGAPMKVFDLKTSRLNVQRAPPTLEDPSAENEEDSGEGVHDVYEVHHDIKETSVHHSECVNRDGFAKPDVMSISTLQESVNTTQEAVPKCMESLPTIASRHGGLSGEPEGCEPETDNLSFERTSLVVKDAHKSASEEGVHQLKIRLQALESERVFMKQAIDSLREENMELKLLQEIAQQLRELKGDVKKTGQLKETLQQDQLSISSFFKGIFCFTGLQNTADAEGNRFLWPFQKNLDVKVNKENHDGLFYLLEKPQSRTTACVTRGLKVRLPGSGETGSLSQNPLVQPSAVYC